MKTVKGLSHRKRGKRGAHLNAKRKSKLAKARRRMSRGSRSSYR